MEEVIRWTVKVSKDTDVSLRSFLAQRGMKKGDLSKFIERAVQKEVFAQTVAGVQARHAGVPEGQIEAANAIAIVLALFSFLIFSVLFFARDWLDVD